MSISAADAMKLRKMTGAGMMDCKDALNAANGDFDRAVEIIREKGKAIANKRADRDASEGVVIGKTVGNKAGIIVLNCETDFVAKNQSFVDLAEKMLDLALASDATTLAQVNELLMDGRTIAAHVVEQTGIIGEKLQLSYYEVVVAESTVAYIHPGNKLATIVAFSKEIDAQAAKDVAMQVAAMNPVAIDKDNVPASTIEKELEIAKEKFRQEGKPEAMLDKIAQGALAKFFKDSTLLNQEFIKDGKMSVKELLATVNKDVKVVDFKRFSLAD
jgi:elongation factor Ts